MIWQPFDSNDFKLYNYCTINFNVENKFKSNGKYFDTKENRTTNHTVLMSLILKYHTVSAHCDTIWKLVRSVQLILFSKHLSPSPWLGIACEVQSKILACLKLTFLWCHVDCCQDIVETNDTRRCTLVGGVSSQFVLTLQSTFYRLQCKWWIRNNLAHSWHWLQAKI